MLKNEPNAQLEVIRDGRAVGYINLTEYDLGQPLDRDLLIRQIRQMIYENKPIYN